MKMKWLGNMFNTVLRFLDQSRDFASSISVEDVVAEYEGVVLACFKSADWGGMKAVSILGGKLSLPYDIKSLISPFCVTRRLSGIFKICRVIGWARILQATRLLSYCFPTNGCRSQRHHGYIAKICRLHRIWTCLPGPSFLILARLSGSYFSSKAKQICEFSSQGVLIGGAAFF